MKKRKKYLYVNQRGFANEFVIYSVTPELVQKGKEIISNFEGDINGEARFISLKEANKILSEERKKLQEQKRAGLNLSQNPVGATEIEVLV